MADYYPDENKIPELIEKREKQKRERIQAEKDRQAWRKKIELEKKYDAFFKIIGIIKDVIFELITWASIILVFYILYHFVIKFW